MNTTRNQNQTPSQQQQPASAARRSGVGQQPGQEGVGRYLTARVFFLSDDAVRVLAHHTNNH